VAGAPGVFSRAQNGVAIKMLLRRTAAMPRCGLELLAKEFSVAIG